MSHLLTGVFRQETHKKTAGVKQDYNRLGNQEYGFKVFMDARMPVTHKEGDRYPLRPPVSMVSIV